MTTAATISARLTVDSTDYESGLGRAQMATQKFSQKMASIGTNFQQLGLMASAAFTVPVVAGATKAIQAYTDLDTEMKNIQSITQATDAETEALRQRFIAISVDITKTRDSAKELAEAYYFIQSAGFAGEEGMVVLEAATMAASAGLTNTMTAGNAILAVLNAYGMEATDAAHVSDVLFKTVDLGVLTFEDLAHQLGDVVSTSATVGVNIEEVGAALALITRKGVSAPEAVTALNQLLLQFISPSDKMKKAAKELGIEWEHLYNTLETKGLAAALEEIVAVGGDSALLKIFGDNVRALKGALTLAGGGLDEFSGIQEQFSDINGRTQEAFATQTQSAAAKWDNFVNIMTSVGLKLVDIFIPIFTQLVSAFAPWLDKLAQADPELLKFIGIIALALAVIGPVLLVLGALASAIGAIGAVVTAVGLPVILVIGLIIAALVLLYLAWTNNWGGIQEKTAAVIAWIQTAWSNFLIFLDSLTTGKLGAVSNLWRNTLLAITVWWNTFVANIKILFQAFAAAWNGDWYTFGEKMREIWDNAWTAIRLIVQMAWANLRILFHNLWVNISNWFASVDWANLGWQIVTGIANGIGYASSYAVQALQRIGNAMLQAWQGFWGIQSPSKLMDFQSRMIMEGGQRGIDRNPMLFSPSALNQQISASFSMPAAKAESNSTANAGGLQIDYERFAAMIGSELQKRLA